MCNVPNLSQIRAFLNKRKKNSELKKKKKINLLTRENNRKFVVDICYLYNRIIQNESCAAKTTYS